MTTTDEMPDEIWAQPTGWGGLCYTSNKEAADSKDTRYIRADKAADIPGLAEAVATCFVQYVDEERRGIVVQAKGGEGVIQLQALINAARAYLQKAPQEGWMPIETAPRDGTEIDVWQPINNAIFGVRRTMVSWRVPEIDEPACHGVGFAWRDGCGEPIKNPTHWLPFPAAPSAKEKS